jgi:hypothetical protein
MRICLLGIVTGTAALNMHGTFMLFRIIKQRHGLAISELPDHIGVRVTTQAVIGLMGINNRLVGRRSRDRFLRKNRLGTGAIKQAPAQNGKTNQQK